MLILRICIVLIALLSSYCVREMLLLTLDVIIHANRLTGLIPSYYFYCCVSIQQIWDHFQSYLLETKNIKYKNCKQFSITHSRLYRLI